MQSEVNLSTPTAHELGAWRVFIECAWALSDILDTELQAGCGLTLRWYDVLVHLEGADEGLRMNELADRILQSRSGLTRVVDRMEEAGLVRRERPRSDRRVVLVLLTPEGRAALDAARRIHRDGIDRHFAQHLDEDGRTSLEQALASVREHVRPLRPGRISG